MTWSDLQPLATSLAGIAAIAVFVATVLRERHPLAVVERLGAVAATVEDPASRRLLQDYRDERAVQWVLLMRAPRGRLWLIAGRALRASAVSSFIVWGAGRLADPSAYWVWWFYGLTIVLGVAANMAYERRNTIRSKWIEQEATWRSLVLPDPASPAGKPST